jgi:hypothetical protein
MDAGIEKAAPHMRMLRIRFNQSVVEIKNNHALNHPVLERQ